MDLADDVARRVKQQGARLVPESGETGHYLAVTSQSPFGYAFKQGPDKEIMVGNGDPNGVHNAPKGSLYVERDAPALWQNTDGMTGWTQVGAISTSGFPITYDDGTVTYSITAASGLLDIKAVQDADATKKVRVLFDNSGPNPDLDIDVKNDVNITPDHDFNAFATNDAGLGSSRDTLLNAGRNIGAQAAGAVNIEAGTSNAHIFADAADVVLQGTGGGDVVIAGVRNFLTGLPTSDPGVSGQLYLTGTTLHVSP